MAKKLLTVGDVIALNETHSVIAEVPKHFLYSNRKGVFDSKATGNVNLKDPNFEYLRGLYIVTHAGLGGGGCGYGPHDVYPDGWSVIAQKADRPEIIVSFFQSGCFTCINEDVEVVGKAKQYWVIEEKQHVK